MQLYRRIMKPVEHALEALTGQQVDYLWCADQTAKLHNEGWRCPSCNRTALECVWRVKKSDPRWIEKYGEHIWTTRFENHHDHSPDWVPNWIVVPRFEDMRICQNCNVAEMLLTRKLGLQGRWSFSPDELRHIVASDVKPQTPFSLSPRMIELGMRCVGHTLGTEFRSVEFDAAFLREYQSRFICHRHRAPANQFNRAT